MTPNIALSLAPLPDAGLQVVALRGREALSEPYRFTVTLVSDDPALPLDDLVGQPASLRLGERTVAGVVASCEQGEQLAEGFGYTMVVVPRLWLLSLSQGSRIYRDLTVPEIVAAVAAEAGVQMEAQLIGPYAPRPYVVQHRESALAFLSRLLESEGIAYHFAPGHDGERVILSDHNGAFGQPRGASLGGAGAVPFETFRWRRQVMPKTVLVHDHDPEQPDVPLQGEASVDAGGFGLRVEEGLGLTSPVNGAQAAARRAQALRLQGSRYWGRSAAPVAAGQLLELGDHFRADLNQRYLVTAVEHQASRGRPPVAQVFAAAARDTFRPAPRTPKPVVHGLMHAAVDARAPGATEAVDARGRYRVAMPFDLGGGGDGQGSHPVPLLSPDEGTRFTLRTGAPVALGFVEGDPDRPVITGSLPRSTSTERSRARNVIQAPGGGLIEMSGSFAQPPQGEAHQLDGSLALEQQHTGGDPVVTATAGNAQVTLTWTAVAGATRYELLRDTTSVSTSATSPYQDTGRVNGTTYAYTVKAYDASGAELGSGTASATPTSDITDITDEGYGEEAAGVTDWIRFAVPHGTTGWSYLRYGESTNESVTSPDEGSGTFAEKANVEGDFTSKYFDEDGEPESTSADRKTFSWSDLDSSDYNANDADKTDSKGSNAYFNHAASSGVFDYTDGNRTTITRGDHQSVTEGHRTDVILGDYRLVIPCRTNGVYDADTYWMRYRKTAGSWRKTERSHVSSDSITWGDTESLYMGFALNGTCGTAVDVTFGTAGDAFVGYKLELGAGITFKYDLGHSFEYATGKSYSNSTKHEVEAKERITMRIPGPAERTKDEQSRVTFAAAMAAISGFLIAGTTVSFAAAEPMGKAKWPVGLALSGASLLAFGTALGAFYMLKDRKVKDDEPSFEMTSDYIKLTIGKAKIRLQEDHVTLAVGETQLDVTEDHIAAWAPETDIVEGTLVVTEGDFEVKAGAGSIANKAIAVSK